MLTQMCHGRRRIDANNVHLRMSHTTASFFTFVIVCFMLFMCNKTCIFGTFDYLDVVLAYHLPVKYNLNANLEQLDVLFEDNDIVYSCNFISR